MVVNLCHWQVQYVQESLKKNCMERRENIIVIVLIMESIIQLVNSVLFLGVCAIKCQRFIIVYGVH